MPSGRRHYRLAFSDAIAAHAVALQFGGRPGILNQSLVESAIQRPYSGYYRSIFKKAAALVESVAGNHGFVDGNKRTCLLLLTLLLDRSGYKLNREGEAAVEEMLVAVAASRMRFDAIEAWMNLHVRRK